MIEKKRMVIEVDGYNFALLEAYAKKTNTTVVEIMETMIDGFCAGMTLTEIAEVSATKVRLADDRN